MLCEHVHENQYLEFYNVRMFNWEANMNQFKHFIKDPRSDKFYK